MQRYIEQIIQDLQNAKKNAVPEPDFSNMEYPEFEEKMLEIEESPNIPCKKIFGVSYEELPPPEKLTDAQMIQLIEAIEDMWEVFGVGSTMPENVPLKLQYELIKDTFLDDFHYMPGWHMTHDYCSGWCPDCKIADYCTSKNEIWTQEELDAEKDGTFYTDDKFKDKFEMSDDNDDELPF